MSDKAILTPGGAIYHTLKQSDGKMKIQKDGKTNHIFLSVESKPLDHQTKNILINSPTGRKSFWVTQIRSRRIISWPGGSLELEETDLDDVSSSLGGALKPLKLTMPGKVLAVKVKDGDIVETGQGLVVVEAMKMENVLLSPGKAKIAKIHVKTGDRLESGTTLVTFEAVP